MKRTPLIFTFLLTAFLIPAHSLRAQAKGAPPAYGSNAAAGHFLQAGDASIYYETYGSGGTPFVLLHGGLYGSIEEFDKLIQQISQHRKVIAIATRGHGRSEVGTQPFSYALFAKDAFAVIRHETTEKVDVLGFSDGAITSYLVAADHPASVRRLVAIGAPRGLDDWTDKAVDELKSSKPSDIARDDPQFVADRKKLMPEPALWDDFVARLIKMWMGPVNVTAEQMHSIQTPTLILAGDRDPYNRTEKVVEIYRSLPHGQLALIPGCGHVVLSCKPLLTIGIVSEFLDKP